MSDIVRLTNVYIYNVASLFLATVIGVRMIEELSVLGDKWIFQKTPSSTLLVIRCTGMYLRVFFAKKL